MTTIGYLGALLVYQLGTWYGPNPLGRDWFAVVGAWVCCCRRL